MSNENTNNTENTENTVSKYTELLDTFKTKVAVSSPKVIDGVVEKLTNAEIEKRQETVIKALESIRQIDRDLKKMKPDQNSFDGDGNLVTATYSKDEAKKIKDLKNKKAKLDEAINLALSDKPDFSKLNNLV